MASLQNNSLAARLVSTVAEYSEFPETLIAAECRKHLGKRVSAISLSDIPALAKYISEKIWMTHPEKSEELKRKIFLLLPKSA